MYGPRGLIERSRDEKFEGDGCCSNSESYKIYIDGQPVIWHCRDDWRHYTRVSIGVLEGFFDFSAVEEKGLLPDKIIEKLIQATKNPGTQINIIFAGEQMSIWPPEENNRKIEKYILLVLPRG